MMSKLSHDTLNTMAAAKRLIVIKVGTSVITNDDGLLNSAVLRHIVDQVCELKKQGTHVILVSSGAMAAGRALLKSSGKEESVGKRQMLAAVGQASLMGEYLEAFKDRGYLCAQVLTTKEDFRTRRHYLNMKNCFAALLEDGVVPIVNENDVISVEELMFTDNDELAGLITSMVDADILLLLTSVEGLREGSIEDGTIISVIEPGSAVWKSHITSDTSAFGKGGMRTKCGIAAKLAGSGIAVHIVSGRTHNVVLDALSGKKIGTHFLPDRKASTVKRWIAHAEGTEKGRVTVNKRTVDILRSGEAVSLLPVGIVAVEGEFEKDDIIRIVSERGEMIGLGKAKYNAERVKELLGKKGEKPLVHYDYLYIA